MKFIKIFLLVLLSQQVYAGSEKTMPVLLRVAKAYQNNSFGYNIVEQLPAIVYNEIIEGRCKLWDSQKKEIQIAPSTLKNIEITSKTSFNDESHIYIYENWTRTKDEVKTKTLGILFFNKGAKNEDVAYGYVDCNELMQALSNAQIKSDANGWFNVSFMYALNAKFYDFNIVQFGFGVFTSKEESEKVRNDYVGLRGFNSTDCPPIERVKFVTYVLERSSNLTDTLSQKTEMILSQVENVLQTDSALYNKIGGYRMLSLKRADMHVSRIVVSELWHQEHRQIKSSLKKMVIYFNDAALDEIPYADYLNMQLTDSLKLADVIATRNFNYLITKINNQDIELSETFLYQKALLETDWNNLIEKVSTY